MNAKLPRRLIGKRLFDLAALILTVWAWLPLLGLVALLVRIKLGSPIIFVQARGGLGGGRFQFIKFRSMLDTRDGDGQLLPDEQRMTGFSRKLRSTSLDELPSLFNVLKGDMSLVGPRPLMAEYLPLYSEQQARRHEVLPGVTGWAQVNGRNAISWEEKFSLDVWYVDHRSLWLDLKILFLTVFSVFRAEGVAQPGHVTKEKFKGSRG